MTNEAEHTPTPWELIEDSEQERRTYTIVSHTGEFVMDDETYYNSAPSIENAAFIVRAVNCHDELVKALEAISGWSKCQCVDKHGDNVNCPVVIAEKALHKARGEA